jgi:hypothetical protein
MGNAQYRSIGFWPDIHSRDHQQADQLPLWAVTELIAPEPEVIHAQRNRLAEMVQDHNVGFLITRQELCHQLLYFLDSGEKDSLRKHEVPPE